jgi:Transposase DDE domain
MPRPHKRLSKRDIPKSFTKIFKPALNRLPQLPVLEARGHRPLRMTFEDQLKALVYFHLQEHKSGRHLLQELESNDFARAIVAPKDGIKKSSFFEAINTRGLKQLMILFEQLQTEAARIIPKKYSHLGSLVAIDGSVIEAVASMDWADYSESQKKAKVHLGFDINRNIPRKVCLTNCKVDERPFSSQLFAKGQTGVMDRNYQKYSNFDRWQEAGQHFVCRIRADAKKTIIKANEIKQGSIVFYDASVLLGTEKNNQTQKKVRVVAYRVKGINYWIATDRFDLSAEEVAHIYKLRWNIESFFAWWKRHLKVYHLIARSEYGLMVQILAGLITYLLLAIYCHEEYNERVSIKRLRELRINIQNEARVIHYNQHKSKKLDDLNKFKPYANT